MANQFEQCDQTAVNVVVELGSTSLPRGSAGQLSADSVIALEQSKEEPVNVYADGRLVARGELVAIESRFWIRVTECVHGVDAVA